MKSIYIAFFLLLAAWGGFASYKQAAAKRPRSGRSWLGALVVLLLIGGALMSAVGFLAGRFAPWMLIPIGVSYLMMLPLPCYFPWITATSLRHTVRNVIFVIIAALFLALGFGVFPISWIGI